MSRTIVLLLLVLIAGWLRFYNLERQSLWNDEIFSIDLGKSSLVDIQSKLASSYHHPPLYFFILHFLFKAFGDSIWILRAGSAFFGALTVGLVFLVSSNMLNIRAGILASLICMVAPFHLAYSQEGRPYALAAFLCLLSCWLLIRLLSDPGRGWYAAYGITLSALLYTHHWGIFIAISQFIFVLFFQPSPGVKRSVTLTYVIVALSYLPELPALFHQSTIQSTSGMWWVDPPNSFEFAGVIEAFSGTFFKMASSVFDSSSLLKIISVIITAAALGLGSWQARRASLPGRLLFFTFFGSILLPLLISFFRPEIFIWYRHTVIVFPLFCICVCGFTSINRLTIAGTILIVMLIAIESWGMIRYNSWSKSNVRESITYAESVSKDSVDMIIRPKSFAPFFAYYYHGTALQLDETYLDKPLGEIVDTAASFVYVSLDVKNEIRDYMDGHFIKIFERRFPGEAHLGIVVDVYKQPPDEDDE